MSGLEGLSIVANIISVVDISARVLGLCAQYARDVKNANNDKARLLREVTALYYICNKVKANLEGVQGAQLKASRELPGVMATSEALLKRLDKKLAAPDNHGQSSGAAAAATLKWPFQNAEVERMIQDLRHCTHLTSLALQIDQTAAVLSMERNIVLSQLPVARGASFDSYAEEHGPKCLSGTRVEVQRKIADWAADPSSKTIFWLNGKAGTGKSTISRTVAQSFAEKGHLVASFLFQRSEADRRNLSKFFTTLASDLVVREPAAAFHIKEALDRDPTVIRKTVREQFDKLFYEPLSSVRRESPAVVVIDALDECDSGQDIRLLVHLLSRAENIPIRLKIFITSRPDLHPRLAFQEIHGVYQDIILEELSNTTIKSDILKFLKYELTIIRDDYNKTVVQERQLADDWPSTADVEFLTNMAIPLFIFAATVCRVVAHRGCRTPDEVLKDVLALQSKARESQSSRHIEQLEATYMPVLNKLLSDSSPRQRKEAIESFKEVVGPLIILASPLPTGSLANILDISKNAVDARLDLLHSVFSIPSDAELPVRMLHLSFRDFLTSVEVGDSNPFWIDEKKTHDEMARKCLRLMSGLRPNICNVESPNTPCSKIASEKIKSSLSQEMQYACTFWVYHLGQASLESIQVEEVYCFLKRHLLHWIEALCLLGRATESLTSIRNLKSLLKMTSSEDFSKFLYDTERCLLANLSVISHTPLQLYSSFLIFAPNTSILRRDFKPLVMETLCFLPQVKDDWDQCLQTLEGPDSAVNVIAFSPDSNLIASASTDQAIRLWHAESGNCIHVFEGHDSGVSSLCFSLDSQFFASASLDKTVRVWSSGLAECTQVLCGHSKGVRSVAFSPDSSWVVSGSSDDTIRLWNADSGICTKVLKGHTEAVVSVIFSHDSALIASASNDNTIRVWNVRSEKCVQIIQADVWESSLLFLNNLELVSASFHGAIRIWRIDSGRCTVMLENFKGEIYCSALSKDSRYLALCYEEQMEIWSVDSGRCLRTLRLATPYIRCLEFSHDSTRLVSGSSGGKLTLWRLDPAELLATFKGESDVVISSTLSPDSKTVAVECLGDPCSKILVWNAESGALQHTIETCVSSSSHITFSPDSKLLSAVGVFEPQPMQIWQVDSGQCIQTIKFRRGQIEPVYGLNFSQDASHIAVVSGRAIVHVGCVASGGSAKQFALAEWTGIYCYALSSDLQLLATQVEDEPLCVWSVESGKCRCKLPLGNHEAWVDLIEFSGDSSLLFVALSGGGLMIWRGETSRCIFYGRFEHHFTPPILMPDIPHIFSSAETIATNTALHMSRSLYAYAASEPGWQFGLGISRDKCWVTWNGDKLLWLPPDFRPERFWTSGPLIVIQSYLFTVVLRFRYPPLFIGAK